MGEWAKLFVEVKVFPKTSKGEYLRIWHPASYQWKYQNDWVKLTQSFQWWSLGDVSGDFVEMKI